MERGILQSVEPEVQRTSCPGSTACTARFQWDSSASCPSARAPEAGRRPISSQEKSTPPRCCASRTRAFSAHSMAFSAAALSERTSYKISQAWAMVFTEVPPAMLPTLNVVRAPSASGRGWAYSAPISAAMRSMALGLPKFRKEWPPLVFARMRQRTEPTAPSISPG